MRRTPPPALLAGLLLLPACRVTPQEPEGPPPTRRVVELPKVDSVEGRPIVVHDLGDGREVVLLIAAIHGDEPAGAVLLEELVRHVRADATLLAGKRAVVIPVANPDGLAAEMRRNANGIDLNRNFPASNFRQGHGHGEEPLSEPETRFLARVADAYRPVLVVSLHQPADRIDYDGPAAGLSHRLAAVSPFEVRRMGARPGSLGSWLGRDRGVPVLTIELPGSATELTPAESWELYGALLLEALRLAEG